MATAATTVIVFGIWMHKIPYVLQLLMGSRHNKRCGQAAKFQAPFNPWHRKQLSDSLIILITNEMPISIARTQTQCSLPHVYHTRAATSWRVYTLFINLHKRTNTHTHTLNNWQNIFVARLIRIWLTITSLVCHLRMPPFVASFSPVLLPFCSIVILFILVVIIVIAFIADSSCIYTYFVSICIFSAILCPTMNVARSPPLTSFHSHNWRIVVGKSQIQLVLSCELYLFQSIWVGVSVACRLYTINKS